MLFLRVSSIIMFCFMKMFSFFQHSCLFIQNKPIAFASLSECEVRVESDRSDRKRIPKGKEKEERHTTLSSHNHNQAYYCFDRRWFRYDVPFLFWYFKRKLQGKYMFAEASTLISLATVTGGLSALFSPGSMTFCGIESMVNPAEL